MGVVYAFLDFVSRHVRVMMQSVARLLNRVSGGRLSPNAVTITSLLAHVPIALLIATGRLGWAAILLVIFGLFDALDGELARLQNKVSSVGMLLDSATDRMKEIILYSGIAFYLVVWADSTGRSEGSFAALTALALGGSVLVSYMNAWGEVVMAGHQKAGHQVNKSFRTGLLGFEVRMFTIVFGLATGWVMEAVFVIALLSWITAFERLNNVVRRLA